MSSSPTNTSDNMGIKRSAEEAGLELHQPAPKRVALPKVLIDENLLVPAGSGASVQNTTTAITGSSPLSTLSISNVPSDEEFCQLEKERLEREQTEREGIEKKKYEKEKYEKEEAEKERAEKEKAEKEKYDEWARDEVIHALKRIRSSVDGDKIDAATSNMLKEEMVLFGFTITEATTAPAATTIKNPSRATQTEQAAYTTTSTQTTPPTSASKGTQTMTPSTMSRTTQTAPAPTAPAVPSWEVAYQKELEQIRRKQPYVFAQNVEVLKTRLRSAVQKKPVSRASRPVSSISAPATATATGPAQVILLDSESDGDKRPAKSNTRVGGGFVDGVFAYGNDDDFPDYVDDGDDYGNDYSGVGYANDYGNVHAGHVRDAGPQQDDDKFYGLTGNEHASIAKPLLRFQDREHSAGRYPSATAGHRLDMQRYLDEVGSTHLRDPEAQIARVLAETSWGARAGEDEDEAVARRWLRDGAYSVQRGFPLVEDVEFVVPDNLAAPDGDCYWRSLALHLYGDDGRWDLVKAEHLAYLHHVLTRPLHPRYDLYKEKLNRKFFETASTAARGPFVANLWQVLHLAHAWTPALVQQVTADLYNVCLITFTREQGVVTETAVRGSFNARHLFLQFSNGNHFQPMCPNYYAPSEFRYPRVTTAATSKYVNAPKETSRKSALEHPWRNDFTASVPAPVPRLHGCDVEQLRQFLGSNPTS